MRDPILWEEFLTQTDWEGEKERETRKEEKEEEEGVFGFAESE